MNEEKIMNYEYWGIYRFARPQCPKGPNGPNTPTTPNTPHYTKPHPKQPT